MNTIKLSERLVDKYDADGKLAFGIRYSSFSGVSPLGRISEKVTNLINTLEDENSNEIEKLNILCSQYPDSVLPGFRDNLISKLKDLQDNISSIKDVNVINTIILDDIIGMIDLTTLNIRKNLGTDSYDIIRQINDLFRRPVQNLMISSREVLPRGEESDIPMKEERVGILPETRRYVPLIPREDPLEEDINISAHAKDRLNNMLRVAKLAEDFIVRHGIQINNSQLESKAEEAFELKWGDEEINRLDEIYANMTNPQFKLTLKQVLAGRPDSDFNLYMEKAIEYVDQLRKESAGLNIVQIYHKLIDIIGYINAARPIVFDAISTSKEDPALSVRIVRQELASKVEGIFVNGIQEPLNRLAKSIRKKIKDHPEILEGIKKEDRPRQLPGIKPRTVRKHTQFRAATLVNKFGDKYGINSLDDWGKLPDSLKDELITVFEGYDRQKIVHVERHGVKREVPRTYAVDKDLFEKVQRELKRGYY